MDYVITSSLQELPTHPKEGCLFLIDKPIGWTSFDVVNKIRYSIKHRFSIRKIKVGHTGTLDPLATGLLLLCIGRYTKLVTTLMGHDKVYSGVIKLGATTPTYDRESEPDHYFPTEHISGTSVKELEKKFRGEQWQSPPIFSALKVGGVAAYKLARTGRDPVLDKRRIIIHEVDLNLVEEDKINFRVSCGKGTYIRSLAHDIGKELQSGAHLYSLRRDEIGSFSVNDALQIEEAVSIITGWAVD